MRKNNKIFKYIKIIILIFILMVGCNLLNKSAPTDQKVHKSVEDVKKEEIRKNKTTHLIGEIFKSIVSWLRNYRLYIKIIVITVIVLILLILTYLIIRYIMSRKFVYEKQEEIKKEFKQLIFEENFIKELIKRSKFSEAIVYLHNCTIFYLITNKITYKKNMTNYDFYKKIADKNMKNAFKNIYIVSEKILFDDYAANEQDYTGCREYFNSFFITV